MAKRKRKKKEQQKRRYGPRSLRDQAQAPKGSHIDDHVQLRKNNIRELKTLRQDRYGFTLMWTVVPDLLLKMGIKPWGTYDPKNSHGGRIWGWKKEVNLSEPKVKRIVYEILERNCLTWPQLAALRKALSYAWQLHQGVKSYVPQKHRNWNAVKVLFATIKRKHLPKTTQSTLPEYIPSYEQLEKAFTSEWYPGHPMNFVEFESSVVCAYDTFVFGLRSNEDVKRVKNSKMVRYNLAQLFMSVGFVDGRCKLPEKHRPWNLNRVCFCEGGRHVSPTPDDVKIFCTKCPEGRLNPLGNPHPLPFDWSSNCPLGAQQFISLFKDVNNRSYPKLNKSKTGFTSYNITDPVDQANLWFIAQGVTEKPFSHNSGRKALGVLLEHNSIPYELGFECHADEFVTFRKHYSFKCFRRDREEFTRRTQHDNPLIQCAALRMIANGFGRGPVAPPPPLSRQETYMHNVLLQTNPALAESIRTGQDVARMGIPERPDDFLPCPCVPGPPLPPWARQQLLRPQVPWASQKTARVPAPTPTADWMPMKPVELGLSFGSWS